MEHIIDPSKEPNWKFYGKDLVILLPNLHEWPDYDGIPLDKKCLATSNHLFTILGDLKFKQLLRARRILLVEDKEVWDFDKYDSERFSFMEGVLEFFKIASLESKVYLLNNNLLSNYKRVNHLPISTFLINSDLKSRSRESLLRSRNSKFKYTFVCLNRKPRIHRKEILNFIKGSSLKASTLYTEDTFNEPSSTVFGHSWNELPSQIIGSCMINIVTETSFYRNDFTGDACFITEKTDKCLNSMMPFIVVGHPHTLKILKRLGFKTFSTIWDESYDEIVDDKKRMSAIKTLLSDINNWSDEKRTEAAKELKEIVKYNYDHYSSLATMKENLKLYNFTDDPYWSFVMFKDLLDLVDLDKRVHNII